MRQWAFIIGINHYQHLQPLSYARQDGEAFHRGLITFLQVAPEQTLLFIDSVPGSESPFNVPTRLTLQNCLERLTCHSLQAEDHLCFFFSGHGLCDQGQDYLMPIDGNPQDCRSTALPMEMVFQCLKHCPTDRVLVLLDASRQVEAEQLNFGVHTAYLAQQTGIPTILACQPGQVSQSTVALQQGLFTRSLLEALQTEQPITLAYLERYLGRRLPELCQLYGYPVQQVLTVFPSNLLDQPLFLQPARVAAPVIEPGGLPNPAITPPESHSPRVVTNFPEAYPSPSDLSAPRLSEPLISLSPEGWHWVKLGVGVLAALIFSGLLLSYLQRTGTPKDLAKPKAASSLNPRPNQGKSPGRGAAQSQSFLPAQPNSPFTSILGPAQARTLIKSDQASPFWDAIQEARTIPPDHPEYPLMPQAIASWSQDIWTIAQQRASRGEFDTAILAAALVPPDQAAYGQARAAIRQWCPLFRYNPLRNIDQQKQAAAICQKQPTSP